MNSRRISVGEVFERIKPGGSTNEDMLAMVAKAGAASDGLRSPWFVRALVAVSAWIASLMFLAFVYGSRIVSSPGGSIILGAMLVAGAVFLRRSIGSKVVFLTQLALALSLAGQALLIFGMGEKFRTAGAALVAIGMSLALVVLYPDKTHRFLSTLVVVSASVALIYDWHISYGLQFLVVGLACAAGSVWHNESLLTAGKIEPFVRPVGYGLVLGLFFLLIPSVVPPEFRTRYGLAQNWIPATAALTALLAYLEYRLFVFHDALRNFGALAVLFLGTVGLALAALKAPGIIAALIMLVLGFHRANRIIAGISIGFLAVFLSAFYYNLDITLLTKSYVLLVSGAILIALRIILTMVFPFAGREATHD